MPGPVSSWKDGEIVTAQLPDELVRLLDGTDPDRSVGLTFELVTVDAEGWPRVALLSVGEVLALDASRLRLALWPGSHTTANLTRSGRCTLALVWSGAAVTLRLVTCRGADLREPELAVFDGRVLSVRRDEVPYARLTSGITYELPERAEVVERWASTIDKLRGHPGCEPGPETSGAAG